MKLLAIAAMMLLAPKPGIRFDGEGIRVGDVLVQGPVLELKDLGHETLLASGSTVEPLAAAVEVELASDRVLTLEPGVRVTRAPEGYRFSTHGYRKIKFAASGETFLMPSPVTAAVTPEGWTLGDRKVVGSQLRASTETQDEESNLERMKQSAEKVRTGGLPKLSTRRVRVFRGNPLDAGEAVSSVNIRLIPQISPSGAP